MQPINGWHRDWRIANMIPVGYMAKRVATKPDWLRVDHVKDIYSVSNCISEDFADYINFWKHNGYWLFDSPNVIEELAAENNISLDGAKFFYYEVYEYQCYEDDPTWETFEPEASFTTNIEAPKQKHLEGYDVVSFSTRNAPECSYLSCNSMAEVIRVNEHCLIPAFEEAKQLLENKAFEKCEPGPCRIFAVYSLPDA
jgi:hypothetical protein